MTGPQGYARPSHLPQWVPDAARNYLVHTETGLSIRALARANACHPSTVLRQVRRFEGRRDDPLIDAALKELSARVSTKDAFDKKDCKGMTSISAPKAHVQPEGLTQLQIEQEAKRVLRRLCEQGAVLAVAREMETSVVVRQSPQGEQLRTAVVGREVAQAMALKDWITCPDPDSRIARYFITNTGRAALRRLTARDENRAGGFTDKSGSSDCDAEWDIAALEDAGRLPNRPYAVESPLVGLSRRKDRSGKPFLPRDLVAVGERLREDYELVVVGLGGLNQWEDFMTGEAAIEQAEGPRNAVAALERIKAALADLGPGLGDVVLRCCCLLEGLEQTERTMGWSARSGKIVLRIALQRLKRHYDETLGKFGPMIG